MDRRIVRDVTVVLPDLDDEYLDPFDDEPDEDLDEVAVTGGEWVGHRLGGGRIDGSRLTGVTAREAEWTRIRVARTVFERCDLSAARWTDVALDRVELRGCRLSGLRLARSTLRNVVFDGCRLDYASWLEVTAAGGVALVDCVLTEAALTACRLPGVVLDGCTLDGLALSGTDLRGADLRGNELAGITGLDGLRGVRLDRGQLPDLAAVAARDLDVVVEE
ncbi:hypothetical protein GCM10010123_05110 [Pilimelia anulata]|uniref:Pentapeptide repeat-containing protein n=1 Tax=Pilimelia anulata TaxID=53371 RepID=A0A8J3B412_9ACTN|nr:pentapeptide repeat-containing protein [Pilimelia anulata]GGJ78036.1 hypothetical protein GCM10010123_05110 [Pilimelia anulata]